MAVDFNDQTRNVIVNPRDVNKVIVQEKNNNVVIGIGGPQGPTGLQGLTGVQGLQGTQGVQGLQGLQGIQGFDGVVAATLPATFNPLTHTVGVNQDAFTHISSLNYIALDTTPTGVPGVSGVLSWDQDFDTLKVTMNNVNLQVGQEHVVRVKNASGSTVIPDRTLVMFAGATGDTVTVSPAITSNAVTIPSDYIVGITTEDIAADGFGFVTQFGFVNKVDTSAWTVGTLLYPNPTIPGGFVSTRPAAPAWQTPIAAVTRQHAVTGRIFVRAIPGIMLGSIENVELTSPTDGQYLSYNGSIWVNTSVIDGGTP